MPLGHNSIEFNELIFSELSPQAYDVIFEEMTSKKGRNSKRA